MSDPRPHCLVVNKFLPYPANGGGKLRSWALLERLLRRASVTLVAYDDGEADRVALEAAGVRLVTRPWPPSRATLAGGLVRSRSLTSARFWDSGLVDDARRAAAAQPPDVVVVEYAQLLPWVDRIPSPRTVHASHNIESSLIDSWAATRGRAARAVLRAEAAAVRRLEARLARRSAVVSVVTHADEARLQGVAGRIVVCPNGVDPGPPLPPSEEPLVVFIAQLGWSPNADAATWLTSAVWPLVRRRRPEAHLALVGRDPGPEIRALAGPGIEVTGTVPSVRPWLARAAVSVAPLRAGGGSRLKILEALDAARPVVATTVGAEGLEDLVGHGVVLADDPSAFADAVVALLDDRSAAQRLGREGHAAVAARYDWEVGLAPLLDAIAPPSGGDHVASG